jgi:hypothetical protein
MAAFMYEPPVHGRQTTASARAVYSARDYTQDWTVSGMDPADMDLEDMPADLQDNIQALQTEAEVRVKTAKRYERYWTLFAQFCTDKGYDPLEFCENLALLFCGFMMNAKGKHGRFIASIEPYFTALNYVYKSERGTTPWRGGNIAGLKRAFARAQTKRCAAAGMKPPELRVEVPTEIVRLCVILATQCTDTKDQAWWAIFMLMAMHWFRADTMGGIENHKVDGVWQGDVVKRAHGVRTFLIRSLKGKRLTHPILRTVAAPLPNNTVRQQVERVIDQGCAACEPVTGEPYVGPLLLGEKPCEAANLISAAMERLIIGLDADHPVTVQDGGVDVVVASFLPPTTFIASHSWRKFGASAVFVAPGSDWGRIMRWGMWAAVSSAQRYVNHIFEHQPFAVAFYDWMFVLGEFEFTKVQASLLSMDADDF